MYTLRTSWRWRVIALGLLATALFGGCASLEVQERQWIFMPSATDPWAPGASGGMDDVWISLDSAATGKPATLHAVWLAGARPDAPVLLYLHGARRTVDGSAFRMRRMQELGFAVLAVDYRGFGLSTDELPSEAIVNEDARAAWDWIARTHPGRDRYIFGHSLGGAIAVRLASELTEENRLKGLIVEGTFTSIPDVFHSFKWGWLPITPLITQPFDAASQIGRVKVPVLVVHGSRDTLIRPELGRGLYERATAPKRFVLVEGGTHYSTNSVGQAQYRDALRDLFGLGA